jgi:hypothetical protein
MSFLTPQDRTLLIESLRPPADYQLHSAIGTTYSLDLIALMVAPVGFTFFDVDPNHPAFLQLDPLELLEAIRRHASQIVLFCEAGRIAVPKHHRPLLTYLEDRIVQAKAPADGYSFHPKVWIIRYTNPGNEVWYRLLCLSRNLTFDRSWDTVLTLDGLLRSDREKGFGENLGLREFVAALPGMAIAEVPTGIRKQIGQIESEISRVAWDLTNTPFDSIRFWPLGHNGRKTWPFQGRIQRLIVVSPFVSSGILTKLSGTNDSNVLISRPESLDKMSDAVLDGFEERHQLTTQSATTEPDADTLPGSDTPMQGLHAKLYIADDGYDGRLWTGSANATASAFGGNVEFLVELSGKKSKIGVSAFLEKVKGTASFSDLLEPYSRPDVIRDNAAVEALEHELDGLRMPIAAAEWTVTVSAGDNEQEYVPVASTKTSLPEWGEHVSVSCRPLSIDESFVQPLASATLANASFKAVALESLTAFLVIDVRGEQGGYKAAIQFVVNANLKGAPANRKDRILQHMLHDRRALLRFLLLLLADVSDDPVAAASGQSQAWRKTPNADESSEALLEPLLRALDRNPARLKAIQSLLKDLGSTEDGAKLMPDGLQELFAAIWSASGESVS